MKKILIAVIFFVVSIGFTSAQTRKLYINSEGSMTDSAHAAIYETQGQQDSLWLVKQYTLADTLLLAATYKDPDHRTLHGEALAYSNPTDEAYYLKIIGNFQNGKKTGVWREYFPDGTTKKIYTYVDGKLNGLHEHYFQQGQRTPSIHGYYVDDKKDGEWVTLTPLGDPIQRTWYKAGKVKKSKRYSPDNYVMLREGVENRNEAEKRVEEPPKPPIPMDRYLPNLARSIVLPANLDVRQRLSDGLVKFIVEADGRVTHIEFLERIGRGVDEQVIRYLKKSGKWTPGKIDGVPVRVSHILPIKIILKESRSNH